MKKLRLILTYDCPKDCKGCCNKHPQFHEDKVPVIPSKLWSQWINGRLHQGNNFKKDYDLFMRRHAFSEVMFTGGEPMLDPNLVLKYAKWTRNILPKAKIYLYTAYINGPEILDVLRVVDGITITLHTIEDYDNFEILNRHLQYNPLFTINKQLRVNVIGDIREYLIPINWSSEGLYDFIWKYRCKVLKAECKVPDNELLYRIH